MDDGYCFTTRNVPHNGVILWKIIQDQRAIVPIFARNTLPGEAILTNCPENERTKSYFAGKSDKFEATSVPKTSKSLSHFDEILQANCRKKLQEVKLKEKNM